jgi:hypothetical protein
MKRSRLLLLMVVVAVLLLLILPTSVAFALPPAHVYANDWYGWQRAVGTYATENFNDLYLHPNLSVVTSIYGGIDWLNGVWQDQLTGSTTTTWYFSHPIKAWGGWWDLVDPNPGGPDNGVDVWMIVNGSLTPIGKVPHDYNGTFWGFVSSTPFTGVIFNSQAQCYALDNMVWNSLVYYPGFIGKGGMRPGCFGPHVPE